LEELGVPILFGREEEDPAATLHEVLDRRDEALNRCVEQHLGWDVLLRGLLERRQAARRHEQHHGVVSREPARVEVVQLIQEVHLESGRRPRRADGRIHEVGGAADKLAVAEPRRKISAGVGGRREQDGGSRFSIVRLGHSARGLAGCILHLRIHPHRYREPVLSRGLVVVELQLVLAHARNVQVLASYSEILLAAHGRIGRDHRHIPN